VDEIELARVSFT